MNELNRSRTFYKDYGNKSSDYNTISFRQTHNSKHSAVFLHFGASDIQCVFDHCKCFAIGNLWLNNVKKLLVFGVNNTFPRVKF